MFVKGAAFSLLIFWAAREESFWRYFIFFAAALFFYFRPFYGWRSFFYSFAALLVYSLTALHFSHSIFLDAGIAVFSGAAFVLTAGLKNFSFQKRGEIFYYLSEVFYFLIAAVFFAVDRGNKPLFILTALASLFFLRGIFKESLDLLFPEFPKRRRNLIASGCALIVFEFFIAISLLPLGVLSLAALAVLFMIVLEDLIAYHLKGALSRQAILNSATALIVITLFIFFSEQVLKI